jgi:hypothetical protein
LPRPVKDKWFLLLDVMASANIPISLRSRNLSTCSGRSAILPLNVSGLLRAARFVLAEQRKLPGSERLQFWQLVDLVLGARGRFRWTR